MQKSHGGGESVDNQIVVEQSLKDENQIVHNPYPWLLNFACAELCNSRSSSFIFPLLIVFCLFFSVNAWAQFGGGTGSSSDPYIISTAAHLGYLADQVNNGNPYTGTYFLVQAENRTTRTISGMTKMIGNRDTKRFKGHFDGGNDTIELNINLTGGVDAGCGLFGQVEEAVIENVITKGSVRYNINAVAGIVGNAIKSRIENCINYAVPSSNSTTNFQRAGVVGSCSYSTIIGCKNYADINGSGGNQMGGIVAVTYSSSDGDCVIESCENHGNISGGQYISGIVGNAKLYNTHTLSVTNCTNYDEITISGTKYVGGIVGAIDFPSGKSCTISNCRNKADVMATGDGYVGGILGSNDESNNNNLFIDKCINEGDVVGMTTNTLRIGGLVGYCRFTSTIRNSYNTGTVINNGSPIASTYLYIGGLVGELVAQTNPVTIENCYNIGDVKTNNNNGKYIGGLIGYCNGIMKNCYNGGKVSNTDGTYESIGAITGYVASYGEIYNCYAWDNSAVNTYSSPSYNLRLYGTKVNAANVTDVKWFSHDNTTNTLESSISVNNFPASNVLLQVLNNWRNNNSTYLTWVPATSESDNKGMPKFYSVPPCTPLTFASAPNLTATDRQITVSWADLGAASYDLYYGVTDPAGGTESLWHYSASGSTTSYTASRLTNGRTYYFVVKPAGDGSTYCTDNPPSDAVSGTPNCP